jgi:predicted phage terminase large subunit-like protein
MSSTESIEGLVVAKYRCLKSQMDFTRYFFRHRFNRKFVIGDHHREISKALDDVIEGKIKKLLICIAPRYGKTELAVKNFMARGLAVNPESRFIHLSYSDDLALDNSEEVREIVGSPAYQQLFPSVRVKPKSDAKKKWYTTAGGGVYATSTSGQVTGFGAGRVDEEAVKQDMALTIEKHELIRELDAFADGSKKFCGALIIDDSIKPEDADSDVVRTRVNMRWDSTIKNRVNSRNTPIIIIGQRLHPEDLPGYVLSQSPGEWHVLIFPCIKPDGSALWSFKHTIEELHKLRQENELVFERQYQQDPKPMQGILFPSGELNRFSLKDVRVGERAGALGYIDVADQGDDALVYVIGYIFPEKVFVVDVVYTREGVEVTIPACATMATEHNVNYTRVESNNQGKLFRSDLARYVEPTKLLSVTNSQNKFTRIWHMAGFIKKYFYFLHEDEIKPGGEYAKYMKELCSYMRDNSSKRDDAPDATAGLAKFVRNLPEVNHLFPILTEPEKAE